jgi:hypothetical protein
MMKLKVCRSGRDPFKGISQYLPGRNGENQERCEKEAVVDYLRNYTLIYLSNEKSGKLSINICGRRAAP